MGPVDDRVMSRLRKIQALANRAGTEGEAQAAVIAMQNLLSKHGLSVKDIVGEEMPEENVSDVTVDESGTMVHWRGWLAQVIAKNFRCTVYWGGWKGHYRLQFIGLETEASLAQAAYGTALHTLNKLWGEHLVMRAKQAEAEGWKWGRQDGREAGMAFVGGFITGMSKALDENVTKMALVLHQAPKVKAHVEAMHLGRGGSSSRNYHGDSQARNAGMRAGADHVRSTRANKLGGNQRQIGGGH